MKLNIVYFVMALSGVLCKDESKWNGDVKTVLDKYDLDAREVELLSADIFIRGKVNCNNTLTPPTNTFLPTPGAACDQSEIPEFIEGHKEPKSFNVTSYIGRFLNSTFGKKMAEKFKRKGVEIGLLRDALHQTWGLQQERENMTTAFETTFFKSSTNQYFRANSWYSFVNYLPDCGTIHQELSVHNEVYIVEASCDPLKFISSFVFPNHPYEDLIIYTLCAWRKDQKDCRVSVPGSQNIRVQVSYGYDNDGNKYLKSASPHP